MGWVASQRSWQEHGCPSLFTSCKRPVVPEAVDAVSFRYCGFCTNLLRCSDWNNHGESSTFAVSPSLGFEYVHFIGRCPVSHEGVGGVMKWGHSDVRHSG